VAVAVQRDAELGVTQQLLDDLGMLAFGQQQRCSGVPEYMEGDRGQPRTLKEGAVHVGQEVAGLHGPSERTGEHQSEVWPQTTCALALLFLVCSVASKGLH
jgi:hypothetical protein